MDMGDSAVTGDEQHIERDEGVAHPHGDGACFTKIEKHAVFWRHGLAEHQALRALGVVQCQFGNEVLGFTRGRLDGKRLGGECLAFLRLCGAG